MYKIVENSIGNKCWYNNIGQWHREDGPAIEYTNGERSWYNNGLLHRLDGPALEWGKYKEWWVSGKNID